MPIMTLSQAKILSFIIVMGGIMLLLPLRLFTCFIAGFLVYEIVNLLTPHFQKVINGKRARGAVVLLISIIVVSVLVALVGSLIGYLMYDMKNIAVINDKISLILQDLQQQVARFMPGYLPVSVEELKNEALRWLQQHIVLLQNMGKSVLHGLFTMLIGMILGAIVSLNHLEPTTENRLLKNELIIRITRLSNAFRNIVFAQVKISTINTLFTAIFIFVLLPLFGIHLPLGKTLVLLTFILGLLPVIGNLISNTMIFLSGLSLSLYVALAALLFLIVIHKVEYFLNARIVGSKINAKSWELLLAMLIFEAIFGLPGVIAAPIYYAYLKSELTHAGLI